MAKEVVVTHEGYKKLEEELDTLKTVKRSEIAEKIKVARGYGDLSENAEYDAAKEEQAVVEARIADLEATLKVARIMDDSDLSLDTVSIGMHVRILAEAMSRMKLKSMISPVLPKPTSTRAASAMKVRSALPSSATRLAIRLTLPCPTAIFWNTPFWVSAAATDHPRI